MQYGRLRKLKLQLVSNRTRRERRPASLRKLVLLSFPDALDMLHKMLGCDVFLIVLLELIPLVIERLVKVFGVDLTPGLVPLSLYATPLLILGLESREHDWDCDAGAVLQGLNDFCTGVASINLLQSAVIDTPARPAKIGLESESCALLIGHFFDARIEGLK